MVRFTKINKYDIGFLFYSRIGFEIAILEYAIIQLCATLITPKKKNAVEF